MEMNTEEQKGKENKGTHKIPKFRKSVEIVKIGDKID